MVALPATQQIGTTKESSLGWYLICLTLPFSTLYVAGFVRPYEVALLLIILPALNSAVSTKYKRMTVLDKLVMAYAVYMLLSVVVGVSNIYESARAYRYLVLGPVLMYAAIRLLPFSLKIVSRAHYIMAAAVVVQTLIVIAITVEEGRRPKGVPHEMVGTIVKYSLLASYVFVFSLFTYKSLKKVVPKLVTLGLILVLAGGLIASASRGVAMPTVFMIFLATFIWKSVHRRRIMAFGLSSFLVLLVMLIAFSPPKFSYEEEGIIEDARSIERIVSVAGYFRDITERVQFWAWLFDELMRHPVFGYGAAAVNIDTTDIGRDSGHTPKHPHNILMGIIIVSGLLGLIVMMILLFQMIFLIVRFRAVEGPRAAFEKLLLVWTVVFLITSLTNGAQGGIMMLLFFAMGLMQQVVLHGQFEQDPEADDGIADKTVDEESADNRILRKARTHGGNLITKDRPRNL